MGCKLTNNPESITDSAALFNQLFSPATPTTAPSLLTAMPSYISWHRLDTWTLYTVYYGVKDGKTELLPLGAVFGVVNSPGPFTPATRAGWQYSRLTVVLAQTRYKAGKPVGETSRMYRQVKGSARYLNETEVNHLIDVIEETVRRVAV